ncbi:MAG: response regulator transcription factor [Caulobacteraceae bacterium]
MSPAEDLMDEANPAAQPVVLLVEDEVLIRLAMADHLRLCGFKVVEAGSGVEAQELILAGLKIDLVFSDITMPGGIDGVGLAQWMQSTGVDAPVILASGVPRALDAATQNCANVRAVAAKPYDQDEIVAQIRAVLAAKT